MLALEVIINIDKITFSHTKIRFMKVLEAQCIN